MPRFVRSLLPFALATLATLGAGCDELDEWSDAANEALDDKGGKKGKDKGQPVDLDQLPTARDCGFSVGQASPFQGTDSVFLSDSWSFDRTWVTEPSVPLDLALVEVATGEHVEGYHDDDGYYFYFVPFEPVKPETQFLLQGTTPDGCTAKLTTFTTGVWGRKHAPTPHTAYVLDDGLWDDNWSAVLDAVGWFGGWPAVWQRDEGDWALAASFGGQDVCTPTVAADGGFHRGELVLEAEGFSLGTVDRPIPLYDLRISALVTPDGYSLERVGVEALADLWWVGQDLSMGCDQVLRHHGSDFECTTCPDGSDWCAYVDTTFGGLDASSVDASDWADVSFADADRRACRQ